jgi:hypothetical protein
MTKIRNVYKNQILSEDIALGFGPAQQVRRGQTITGTRLALPLQVANLATLALLDPVVSNLALVPENENSFTIYYYKADVTTGAPALAGLPGTWVPQQGSSNTVVSEAAPPFPTAGLQWIRCSDMKAFIWYVDDGGGQWIEDNPSMGGVVTAGATGTFTSADAKTITVVAGLITSIV